MLQPLSWQDKPALIEHLFPVQKLSVESFKEQEARQSKTLTPLGSVLWSVAFVNACY